MKFSEHWLRQHVAIDLDSAALQHRLTMIGLEVEHTQTLGADLDGIVIARIVDCAKHPEADRLQVCTVDAGHAMLLQIVCGAPNARPGLIAPLATVGTRVGAITIKAARLRGVESTGMLCSASELGLDSDASGLMELPDDAPVGQPLADYLGLPDTVIELGITPNRADCFSVRGIAFDVAAACGSAVTPLDATPVPAVIDSTLQITLDADADAPRYVGRVIEGVDATQPTPLWMAERLRRSGIRPVSLLVDVTQYVMLDIGQPMHAFDRDLLTGPIGVRHARHDERLTLLDGRDVALDDGFLVITDADRAVALAGVMGGLDTRVTHATRHVFLEAAHFAPAAIIGRGRRFGLHTDAGHRFERGVDPELPRTAIEAATALILAIAGGSPGPVTEAQLPEHLHQPQPIVLRRARLTRVLGVMIDDADVERILRALGLEVAVSTTGWHVTPPTRRFDLAIEEDLIEEVARIFGYDAIVPTLPGGLARIESPSETVIDGSALRGHLAARGYFEAINYAFVDARLLATWQADTDAVALANPLSAELGVMRTQLLPGLVDALSRNLARQQTRVRLFECGAVFSVRDSVLAQTIRSADDSRQPGISATTTMAEPDSAPIESQRIAAVACGTVANQQWGVQPSRAVDFYDIKGDLDSLAALAGTTLDYRPATSSCGHPGRSADIFRDGAHVGWIGELHPRLLRALSLDHAVVGFEIDLAALRDRRLPRARALSRFPSVRRDLAFVIADTVPWSAIADTVRSAAGTALVDLQLFDRFVGSSVESGFKSLAMGLILQEDSRTLTDVEMDAVQADVTAAMASAYGAWIRG